MACIDGDLVVGSRHALKQRIFFGMLDSVIFRIFLYVCISLKHLVFTALKESPGLRIKWLVA